MSGIKELELESEVDDALATAKSSDTAVVLQFSGVCSSEVSVAMAPLCGLTRLCLLLLFVLMEFLCLWSNAVLLRFAVQLLGALPVVASLRTSRRPVEACRP